MFAADNQLRLCGGSHGEVKKGEDLMCDAFLGGRQDFLFHAEERELSVRFSLSYFRDMLSFMILTLHMYFNFQQPTENRTRISNHGVFPRSTGNNGRARPPYSSSMVSIRC